MIKIAWSQPFVTFDWKDTHYEFSHVSQHVMVLQIPSTICVSQLKQIHFEHLTQHIRQQPFVRFNNTVIDPVVLNADGFTSSTEEVLVQTETRFDDNHAVCSVDALVIHYRGGKVLPFAYSDQVMSYLLMVPLKISSVHEFQSVLRERRGTIEKQVRNSKFLVKNHASVSIYNLLTRKIEKSISIVDCKHEIMKHRQDES